MRMCYKFFYTTWVLSVACQKTNKTTFRTKIGGGGLGEHPKNLGPLHISATVEASNFKFGTQLGFGTSVPKNNVLDQNWRGSEPREHPNKIWDPLRISATVEASNFKCGTQFGFGTSLPKNNVLDQNWRGSVPGEHPKKMWDPYVFLQPLKLTTSNLVHKLGLGLAYQKTTFRTKIGGGLGQGSLRKNVGPPTYFCNR